MEENLKQIVKADAPGLTELLAHVLGGGGKRIRPALTLLASKFYNYRPELLVPMATAVEVLHTATLIHDDTIDNSLVRRGKPTISALWGDHAAVLVGDYLFATSAYLAAEVGNLRAMRIFAQTIMTITSGEIAETFSPFDLKRTREHYYQQIGGKTASLFATAAEIGAVLSEAPEEVVTALKSYGYNLGMSFQVIDDILDFRGNEAEMGKPTGNDLLQGNLTLPAIIFLERYPENNLLQEALENPEDRGKLKLVIEEIDKSAVIPECSELANGFYARACLNLEKLPQNKARESLASLASHVIQRKK